MTSALSAKKIRDLNRMNTAAKRAGLGDMLGGLGFTSTGSYTMVLADISGSSATIWTSASPIGGGIVAATRSGSAISGIKYSFSGSSILISSASAPAMALTVGDVVSYVVFE